MKKAFDPKLNKLITVSDFDRQYGQYINQFHKVNRVSHNILCPACGAKMSPVGRNSVKRDPTWSHPHDNEFCVLKDFGKTKYEMLMPIEPDLANATLVKLSFFHNWERHWGLIQKFAPMTDIFLFISWIRELNKKNIWAYRGLLEWHLPYIFLTTCEFPPPTNVKARSVRSTWIRFYYSNRVRTHEDIWIRVNEDWSILKLTFEVPDSSKAKPSESDLLEHESILPDHNWLFEKQFARPNRFQIERMIASFPNQLN